MSLVEMTCTNPECPGYSCDSNGVVTGHTYFGNKIPATRVDPDYVEGECPLCGEEAEEYELLGPSDIEYLKAQFGPHGDRI